MPEPTNSSEMETARLRSIFQGMHEPAELDVKLVGLTARQVQALLPQYNESAPNAMYGIFVDSKTGKAYGFQSGLNLGESRHNDLVFRRGTLSILDTEMTTINFITQEAHIEAQVSGFMRKHDLGAGSLYINGSTPCLGDYGCNQNLSYMLPPGSRLKVFGMEMEGIFLGRRD
jgi:SCP1.201-like deaminase